MSNLEKSMPDLENLLSETERRDMENPTPDFEHAATGHSNGEGFCCGVWMRLFFTVLTIIIVTPLAIWYSLHATATGCSLEKLYIPALDQSLKTSINSTTTTLDFSIRFQNYNLKKSIYYDPVNVTFSDGNPNRSIIASYIIPTFYQRKDDRWTRKGRDSLPATGLDLDEANRAISANGSFTIRVDLEMGVWYDTFYWYSKRYTLKLGANVKVNGNGTKINRNGINLKPVVVAGNEMWKEIRDLLG